MLLHTHMSLMFRGGQPLRRSGQLVKNVCQNVLELIHIFINSDTEVNTDCCVEIKSIDIIGSCPVRILTFLSRARKTDPYP